MSSKKNKIILFVLTFSLLIWMPDVQSSAGERKSFYDFTQEHENTKRPEEEFVVDVTKFKQNDAGSAMIYHNKEGSKKGLRIGESYTEVTFQANIPVSGLYNIELTYCPIITHNAQIIFGILIDGESPYVEANSCVLSRVYENEEIRQDEFGNDLRPNAVQLSEWRTQFLYDQTGIGGNLPFYFEEGEHEITLCFEGTPLLLESMCIKQEPYKFDYQDYVSLYKQRGYIEPKDVLKIFQAENYYQQSASVLWPDSDRTSPLTQPMDYSLIKINYGGGSQWSAPGQWISWEIDVPTDGFYNLGVKYRQSYLDGLFSSRKISIDGEVPFKELDAVRFNHTDSWKNLVIGNEYEPYSIYLTAGKHVITMENVIGDMSTTMETLQTVITNLNEMYLDVVMITSSDPDPYRDYYVERQLPGLSGQFLENAELLFQVADYMIEVVGGKGSETAFFEDIAYNLESYADDVESLTYKGRIEFFKNDINSLSSKLTQYQNQALDIDYIVLLSTDMEMPRAKENLWEWMSFQAGTFIASFSKQEKKFQDEDKVIKVWFNTGNDQYEILQSMITDIFTPMTGIEVDLELVQGTLIEATVAGNGPDVALGIDASTVVNLALRGALEELDGYDGFDQLIDQYIEGADIPFTLENRTYGIPNSSAFSVMFVRTDIFEQLGLEVPTTWDEMYDVTQVLQRNNMTLATVPGFATLLYQKGGSYYNEEKTKVLFDENVAVEAFTQYTEFYTKYDFPVTFDFLSRFRTGEMPIGIASYATYNSLKYSAPEINGLWEMYPIPGTVRADGSVDYTQAVSGGIGCVMFSHSDNTDAAWEFIKWWSSAETQQRYANDLEAVMGYAARYDTTNLQTLDNIGWTNRELKVLKEQLQYLEYIPIVPGDYYVTRGIDNTYRGVINDGANVRELLTNWTVKINEEIERKRKEFYENN